MDIYIYILKTEVARKKLAFPIVHKGQEADDGGEREKRILYLFIVRTVGQGEQKNEEEEEKNNKTSSIPGCVTDFQSIISI